MFTGPALAPWSKVYRMTRYADMTCKEYLDSAGAIHITSQLFSNYSRNVLYNLETVNKLPKPV